MTDKQLALQIGSLEEYVEEHFLDGNGLVYSILDSSTGQPTTEETFRDGIAEKWGDWKVEGFTRPEFASYENCGMVTGSYMSALIAKHQVTGDAKLLPRIRRCKDAIFYIAEIGRQLEYGFLPKIYGNRFSDQTSTDQYLSELYALDEFRRMPESTPDEKAKIKELIIAAVEFWRKRDYCFTYFIFKDMRWPVLRFPALLELAYEVSGKEEYLREAEEMLAKNAWNVPENSRFRGRDLADWERERQEKAVWGLPDAVSMDTLNGTLALRNAPDSPFASLWRSSLLTIWLEGARALNPDGTAWTTMVENLKDGTLLPAKNLPGSSDNGVRTGWSAKIIRGGMLAAREIPSARPMIVPIARRVMEGFDSIQKCTYLDPRDKELLPARHWFKTRFLSGDSVTDLLWAYWLMREIQQNK